MTALKKCLIDRGVIKEDTEERDTLLAPSNIDRDKLYEFAIEASQYSVGHFSTKLPSTEWALGMTLTLDWTLMAIIVFIPDGRGNPDCAIFDFTNLYSARNACRVRVVKGRQLLMAIVGDSLLEPFWPEGTGCARGFLSSMDASWMFRRWAIGQSNPLDILCERENIYR